MPYANPVDVLARARCRYKKDPEYHRLKTLKWLHQNRKRKAWLDQRATSKKRGVEFNLIYEEYLEFWGDDYHLKGRKRYDLCMGRYGDQGAYEVGNIYKCTNLENNNEGPRDIPS